MAQTKQIKRVLIVGGGSAGWLTACVLAATHSHEVEITLIESANIATIGVGEGTWPTMRNTLEKIGITEGEFIQRCDASFKQGSEFVNWAKAQNHSYYHPFSLPVGFEQDIDMVSPWLTVKDKVDFAHAVSAQAYWCDENKAPRLPSDIQFAGKANYGYHLNADKFAKLLKEHATERLGVKLIVDDVCKVLGDNDGDILAVTSIDHGQITADLFIDCTGSKSLLLGEHFKVSWLSQKHILKNDSAVAVQVMHSDEQAKIASCTKSTAQPYGWIWDIALPTRRGIGYTFASEYCDFDTAKLQLANYITDQGLEAPAPSTFKEIKFNPGFREKLWHNNCVAIGMSAGFLEPLEASALVMIELSAQYLIDNFPKTHSMMNVVANRFNAKFVYRWHRIIDFLKLHYVLSSRDDTAYWQTMRAEHIPQTLQELLLLWQYQPPKHSDLDHIDEVFSAASYQYVLFGMGFSSTLYQSAWSDQINHEVINTLFKQVTQNAQRGLGTLPTNRDLLTNITKFGISTI
ncbi:tryptophan 7-halogenase [Pseudoalteromonas sp. JBTF-M23]|uniref:Tryptophan 7-halogenase n=1 Tax=Pseudoalteromonas caenipelagi TaxID=2726988 RepID=A0A849V7H3_9GAMM|nr:tryptophan halogenase family protein [Pseudoalteromonas caenipelagi]NOU49176.1 tryptophan 7-halogenase [Pseudoalteromonas caenipelagi]